MAIRLHEIHPMLVHYSLALLPLSIGADVLAKVTGSAELFRQSGRHLKTGAQHTVEHLREGNVTPTLRDRLR